jgi:N-acyl-D-aspartate/D-glutamate deacylase
MWVETPALEKNKGLKGKTIGQLAKEQGKGIIDAFLDLVVEEKLETGFMQAEINVDNEAMAKILSHPNAIIGLSDSGAHVQFHGGYGYSTRLLAEWVREKKVMTLEHAVRRLTFDSASALGLYDRGLLRPGMAADIVIFDPDTVRSLPESIVHDFPANGWRVKELAEGIVATIVNGEVLLQDGEHTGALPGRVARNTYYNAHNNA